MPQVSSQNLLSAWHGARRVTIGWDAPETLRRCSDARELTCPGCGASVVLRAGRVRAHHFAHVPGAVCSLPQTEPETEEHRAGKLLIARWLRERFPEGIVTVEAFLPGSKQRADVLLQARSPDGRTRMVALEFQCANLAAREWRRRHALYRRSGIEDLWILGGSRCRSTAIQEQTGSSSDERPAVRNQCDLSTGELERALMEEGSPLLFLHPSGTVTQAGTLARFRPAENAQILRPRGRLSARPLLDLQFPWKLLDWPSGRVSPVTAPAPSLEPARVPAGQTGSTEWLWQWLEQRFHVTPATLPTLFGISIPGQEIILCEPRLWQAAVYYRFIHRRIEGGWWLAEVETWARAYLPLVHPLSLRKLRQALRALQEYFAASGLLTLPVGYSRSNARVAADLDSLSSPPSREEALRLARYRHTLDRP